MMLNKFNAWPESTPDQVSHETILEYLQETSRLCGADDVTIYGARVTKIRKIQSDWHVTWSTLNLDLCTLRFNESYHTTV